MEEIIKEHPSYKILSKAKLIKKIRDNYDDISVKEIEKWYDSRELSQIYKKPAPQNKDSKLVITAPPRSFQIDIAILSNYKQYNGNVDRFLLLVDILSKKAFAYPLKSNEMEDVLDKYEQFMIDVDEPVHSVAGDDFFNNDEFQVFNDEIFVNVYTDVAKDDHITRQANKLGIVDRAVRTIKQMIQKYMLENKTLKWTKFLPEIIEAYNDTPHLSLKGNTPNEVFDDEDYLVTLHEVQKKRNKEVFNKIKFNIGDTVRIMLGKLTFEKEKQKYSSELYTVIRQEGYRFVLKDENGKQVKRRYRPVELQLVKGSVTGRIKDKNLITNAITDNQQINRIMKETDKSYVDALETVESNKLKGYKQKLRNQPQQRLNSVNVATRTTRSGKKS